MLSRVYQWTNTTELGFLNDELDSLISAVNAIPIVNGDLYVPKAGGTMTGSLAVPSSGLTILGSAADALLRTQDGSGRFQILWNTLGTASAVFTRPSEDAWRLLLSSAGYIGMSWASGAGKAAGDPITWETLFEANKDYVKYKGASLLNQGALHLWLGANAGNVVGVSNNYGEIFGTPYAILRDETLDTVSWFAYLPPAMRGVTLQPTVYYLGYGGTGTYTIDFSISGYVVTGSTTSVDQTTTLSGLPKGTQHAFTSATPSSFALDGADVFVNVTVKRKTADTAAAELRVIGVLLEKV